MTPRHGFSPVIANHIIPAFKQFSLKGVLQGCAVGHIGALPLLAGRELTVRWPPFRQPLDQGVTQDYSLGLALQSVPLEWGCPLYPLLGMFLGNRRGAPWVPRHKNCSLTSACQRVKAFVGERRAMANTPA